MRSLGLGLMKTLALIVMVVAGMVTAAQVAQAGSSEMAGMVIVAN